MGARARLAFTVIVCLVAATAWTVGQSKDPFVGTWNLNVAKSKYTPGPAPTSATTTIEAAGAGYKFTVHQVPAKGATQDWSFTTAMDGKPVKVTGNNPNADMVSSKRIDARTYESTQMKAGKETQRQKVVVSADGKTRTVTSTGVDSAGQKINNVAVYEKK